MPYLKTGRKRELMLEKKRANTDGDYNYLYTREYLKVFIAKPEYATIALLAKAAVTGRRVDGVEQLEDLLTMLGVPLLDRQAARLLAYVEFYTRIGRLYEQNCITSNGDLDEYAEAERAIQEKFNRTEVK